MAQTSAITKIKHMSPTKLQGSPALWHHHVLEMLEVNIFLRPGRSHVWNWQKLVCNLEFDSVLEKFQLIYIFHHVSQRLRISHWYLFISQMSSCTFPCMCNVLIFHVPIIKSALIWILGIKVSIVHFPCPSWCMMAGTVIVNLGCNQSSMAFFLCLTSIGVSWVSVAWWSPSLFKPSLQLLAPYTIGLP